MASGTKREMGVKAKMRNWGRRGEEGERKERRQKRREERATCCGCGSSWSTCWAAVVIRLDHSHS